MLLQRKEIVTTSVIDNSCTLENKFPTSRKIKVLMLADYPFNDDELLRGGVRNAVYWLVKGLSQLEGLELYVVSPSIHVKKRESQCFGNTSIIYFPLPNRGYSSIILFSGLRFYINKFIREIRPDIIHAHHTPDYIFTAIRCTIPHIITIHGIFKNELKVGKLKYSVREKIKNFIYLNTEKYYLRKIKNLIAITREIEQLAKVKNQTVNIYRINNAIDDKFFGLQDISDDDRATVLFVATIAKRKGLHYLMEAFKKLLEYIPNAQLRIAGIFDVDPEYVQNLKKKYSSTIEKGAIIFLGGISQEDLIKEYSQCSVFCLPSLAESAPMVIAQALAAGRPVVATRVGGIPDMIKDGVTGYLIQPGNVDEIFSSLKEILSDKSKQKRMGLEARNFAKEQYFSLSVARQTLQAYWDVLTKSA